MLGNCIRESAKFLTIQIPGKGKATYTKHFASGIVVINDIILPILKENLSGQEVHVPADGMPGGTKRVMKKFPIVHNWKGEFTVMIGDDTITSEVFEQVIHNAGLLIGLGTFRPRNRGDHGRFKVVDMQWSEKY
jgi:hypothetical protein